MPFQVSEMSSLVYLAMNGIKVHFNLMVLHKIQTPIKVPYNSVRLYFEYTNSEI